jgi:hypothetical protein
MSQSSNCPVCLVLLTTVLQHLRGVLLNWYVLNQGAAQARRGPDALGLLAGSARHRPAHRPMLWHRAKHLSEELSLRRGAQEQGVARDEVALDFHQLSRGAAGEAGPGPLDVSGEGRVLPVIRAPALGDMSGQP